MSSPACVVVGIPLYCIEEESNYNWDKYELLKKQGLAFNSEWSKGYKRGSLVCVGAGYEDHTTGCPNGVLGIVIFTTWNDAIDVGKYCKKIEEAKVKVRETLQEEPSLFVVGEQT